MKPDVWKQIKNISCDEVVRALLKDGWVLWRSSGALRTYRSPHRRQVTIHYHSRSNYGCDLLKDLLNDIGWTEDDLHRLKLIK